MGILINSETAGKDRNRLCKCIVVALREMFRIAAPDNHARDLAAFTAMSLDAIHKGIDETVKAWEKRDFWKKSEQFRMEWEWTGAEAKKIREALLNDDWSMLAALCASLAQRLAHIEVSEKNRLGRPWEGAYSEFMRIYG